MTYEKTYPYLFSAYNKEQKQRLDKAIDIITEANEGKSALYNADYLEAKDVIGRAIWRMWEMYVQNIYLSTKEVVRHGDAIRDNLYYGAPMGAYDLTTKAKKLEKIKDKLPVWSKTRHQMENVLELNYRERRNILQQKKAVK